MAKKRKTREQKILADLRHSFTHSFVNQPTPFEAKIQLQAKTTANPAKAHQTAVPLNSYPYLAKDLSKTTLLTLTILAFQIILFFLLTHHIFRIPYLTY